MLVPLSWLKEYIETDLPVKKLADRLTEVGFSVEVIKKVENDEILEIEVTPNRPDCLSISGIAREVGAITGNKVKIPKAEIPKAKGKFEIEIVNDFKLCPRYTALIIDGIQIKPSPPFIQKRLKKIGLRPINNLVDITNYVMFETGNPLHAFDYDKITPKKLLTQKSKGGEKFESVDGISYVLPKDAIIIKDSEDRVIDLCGLKGGSNTGISEQTNTLFLHAPVYNPVLIRRASQALSLRSDASAIFERGANPGGTLNTLKRAASLILKYAGGEITSEIIDLKKEKFEPWTIKLRHPRLEKILGIKINPTKVKEILESLGMESKLKTQNSEIIYDVAIPTHRGDLKMEEDLIEEVARIYGYNNFPKTLPLGETPEEKIPFFKDFSLEEKIKQILADSGYSEIYTYSLISKRALENIGLDLEKALRVSNPVSGEYEYLRPSLIPNLLSAFLLNQPNFSEIKLFEFGKIYPEEKLMLSGIANSDYYHVKGILELIFQELGIENPTFKPYVKRDILYHPAKTAVIETSRALLGTVGEVNPAVLTKAGIKGKVVIFNLDFELISKLTRVVKKFFPIPEFPPIIEDLAFVIPPKTFVGDLIQLIKVSSSIIQSVELLDVHENTRTFRIIYQHPDKTLTDKEVGKIRKKIIESAEKKFGARIKG
ncbi:phenylalanine--tRNA ligase subunit beta [Candidatus Shapirobacteria bacterium CG10_big_fil_rev_8_21_14_0_10_40_9]|uniref:Phenylalanine--tRNA ligase beta subunit n=1 Tax=Candidatus Shapirobacteria bacterium CG10_big_fil_rev_8_21_14_0_10_40_9 TaxID=1974888 RepID=A0A2M8L421_9BACT|nr:MAG: phenylalanine--tRNA ligase subunit beta [Candidatus Shapirobacteria bacterium CG10_big_fil_rev_8_21_14_0_10_40_9]